MRRLASVLFVCVVVFAVSESALAQGAKPVQLALFNPIQIFDESVPIHGFRFNLIYGSNSEMMGLDIGLVNRTLGETLGVQWGVVGLSGSFTGWQGNWGFNQTDTMLGLQTGAVNFAEQVTGVQFAIVNFASRLTGLQLGLINIAKNGFLPVFPFFNFGMN